MKYSVIIPVYNAEETLARCVDSILSQGDANAEIILVNDGSTDRSGAICEEYALNNASIRCISQQNAGVSAARNAGIDAARGDHILFVDSDDHVAEGLFSEVDKILCNGQPDLLLLSSCFDRETKKGINIRKPFFAFSRGELMPRIIDAICNKAINGPVAKVYKREIIESHHVRFPVGVSVAEDRAFNIVYTLYINSFAVSEFVGYCVNTANENSLSRKRHDDLQKQFAIAQDYIEREITAAPITDKEKDLYRQAVNFGVCRGVYHDAKLMVQDRLSWLVRQKVLFRLCKQINSKRMKYPKTRYCTLIALPVRFCLTPVIDAAAIKLTRRHDAGR